MGAVDDLRASDLFVSGLPVDGAVRDRATGADVEDLRAAIASADDPAERLARAIVTEFLDSALPASNNRDRSVFGRFVTAAGALARDDNWVDAATMANMLGLVERHSADDFVTLAELVTQFGHRRVATTQANVDRLLRTGPATSLATRLVRTLACTTQIVDQVRAGVGDRRAVQVGECCACSAFWLTIAHVRRSTPGVYLDTVEEAVWWTDHGDIEAWRAQVAIFMDSPWTPYASYLRQLLVEGERPTQVRALDAAVDYCRSHAEVHERQLVAREIRQLVAVSGSNQREFAALVGTSAPRLSTYVNGLVTPAATMLLRIRRISKVLEERRPVR